MLRLAIPLVVCVVWTTMFSPQSARAQPGRRPGRSKYSRLGTAAGLRDYLYRRPTVSPYLNLVRDQDSRFGMPNYQTLVRPQLRQQAAARRHETSITRMQRQVNTIGRNVQRIQQRGSYPTGHPTRFMTYLHYYPGLRR